MNALFVYDDRLLLYCQRAVMPWWRHQMETFSALLAFCAGNSPVTGEFPAQRPVKRSFDVFFDLHPWINDWINNREAGDLRHNRSHYDVIVMAPQSIIYASLCCRGMISFSVLIQSVYHFCDFPWSPVSSPHKGQWRGVLMFSLICAWKSGWANNREAVDMRRHRTHYGFIVMVPYHSGLNTDIVYDFASFTLKPCVVIVVVDVIIYASAKLTDGTRNKNMSHRNHK